MKFAFPDSMYEKDVEPRIQELVHDALDAYEQGKQFAALREADVGTPSLLVRKDARLSRQAALNSTPFESFASNLTLGASPLKYSDTLEAGFPDNAWLEIDDPSQNAANAWVENSIRGLKFNQDEVRINFVFDGSIETCNWILSKTEFQKWNAPASDSVLFVQGGPGLGKSVLAKFLVKRLKRVHWDEGRSPSVATAEQSRKPIVAHFFPRGTESSDVENSPKAILINVIYQIWEADPFSCEKAIRNLFNRFNQSRNLEFYWNLFNEARRIVTRDLYCIVDGLDECIKEFKFPRNSVADEKMEGFLRRLCDIARDPSTMEKTSCTKILITTRPSVEVDNVTMGTDIVLKIQESDTKSAVGKFVEDGVRRLGEMKHLSLPAQDFIKEEISQKSGHVFLTAQTALKRLRTEPYDLENREVVSRALIRVSSQRSDDAYKETLEILESAPQQDQVKAARILRILFFLQSKLSLLELEHALLVDVQRSELIPKATSIPSTLDVFIRANLALLVDIDDESMVSLQHQTVREYLQSLSGDRWQIYSCAERKGGHLQLALICICYLVSWRRHAVTQEDIDAEDGVELVAKLNKASFIEYTSCYWDLHAREAGELIIPRMPLIDQLLGFDSIQEHNENYLLMLSLRWAQGLDQDYLKENQDFFRLLPGSFLASKDLVEVLRGHTRPRKVQKHGMTRRIAFWKSQKVENDAIEADFDLDMQDGSGSGLTPLHCACHNGHLEVTKLLLDCGASGKVYDLHRQSPFSMAVEGGWKEVAEMLIERNQCWDDSLRGDESLTFHMACMYGMSRVVRHLLGKQYDANAQVLDGWTPVHVAASYGQIDTLEVLLTAGGSPESNSVEGNTSLHFAAEEGFLTVIEMLFRFKPDMDPKPLNLIRRSPHHNAAAGGHLKVLEYLETKHKDIRPDEDGILPIHLAAAGGHLPIVNYLANESTILARDKKKRLPIHSAALNGHLETVRRLLQLGREVEMNVDVRCREWSATVEEGPDGLLTPLYLAVIGGYPKVAKYLMDEGADPSVRSSRKRTLLHGAAEKNLPEIFELLKDRLDSFGADEDGMTPLHIAAYFGSLDIILIYLEMQNVDAGLNMVDAQGNSALTRAIVSRHAQIAEKLVSTGANIHHLNEWQTSSLMLSIDLEDVTVFKRLLEEGVDVNIPDVFGRTVLHSAAELGKLYQCEMLIERGANIHAEMRVTKLTPLHSAGQRNNMDIVLRLLEAGADPFKRDLSGTSILDYVMTYQPMLNLLRKYRGNYQPQSSKKQTDTLRQFFCPKLCEFPSTAPTDGAGKVSLRVSLSHLLYASWYLKEYDIHRIFGEYLIDRSADSTPDPPFECDACRKTHVKGSWWSCKQCPSTDLCNDCYHDRSKGVYSRGCGPDHEYLESAGEEWRKLERGKVNAKGQTFWEWIAELREIYLKDEDVGVETSGAQHEEMPTV